MMKPLLPSKEEKLRSKLKIQPPSGSGRPHLISTAGKKNGELSLAPLDYFFLGGIYFFSILSLILAASA